MKMKIETRDCVICGKSMRMSGLISLTLPMHIDCACRVAPDALHACRGLLDACNELMTEFVSKKRAANWGVINDAMVSGVKVLALAKKGD